MRSSSASSHANLDNSWNTSVEQAAEKAKRQWTEVTSLKAAGKDYYKITHAEDADASPTPLGRASRLM